MVNPIYETTEHAAYDQPKPSFQATKNSTIEQGAVNGIGTDHLAPTPMGKEIAGPKNDPTTWSAGS